MLMNTAYLLRFLTEIHLLRSQPIKARNVHSVGCRLFFQCNQSTVSDIERQAGRSRIRQVLVRVIQDVNEECIRFAFYVV